jgi:hypothetical protein
MEGVGKERCNSRMNAGRYTQLNMGAIHAQWICSKRSIVAAGMSVWIAAFPKAKVSQVLASSAVVPRASAGCWSILRISHPLLGGGACTADVGP